MKPDPKPTDQCSAGLQPCPGRPKGLRYSAWLQVLLGALSLANETRMGGAVPGGTRRPPGNCAITLPYDAR